MTNKNINSYKNLILELESTLKELNRQSNKDLPIKLRYQTPVIEINQESPFVILLGEQHSGSMVGEINFFRSNRCLLNTVKSLAKFPIKAFLKEGCSNLEPHPKLQEKSIDELLHLELNPLQIFINKINRDIPALSIENEAAFIYYAILSFMYSSRPGNVRFREIEMKRIEYLIADLIESKERLELVKNASNQMIRELNLLELIPEKFCKKNSIENNFEELKLLTLRSNIKTLIPEESLRQFDLRVNKALLDAAKTREYKMAELINTLEPNLYLALVGDYHLSNLIRFLKEKNIPTMALSAFSA